MIFGRIDACERLERLVVDARGGRSGSLVLTGPAGIGKTTLLHFAQELATDSQVLRATGSPAETGMPYAALSSLLAPILELLPTISTGQADALREHLRSILSPLPQLAGVTAAHLLQTQTPPAATTTEQQIRGGADGVADWIVLVSGYEAQVLQGLAANELGASALDESGAMPGQMSALYRLCYSMTPDDL